MDPCDAPNSLSVPVFDNIFYTIGDANAADYVHPEFTANPTFCPVSYQYSITTFVNGVGSPDSAITQDTADQRRF